MDTKSNSKAASNTDTATQNTSNYPPLSTMKNILAALVLLPFLPLSTLAFAPSRGQGAHHYVAKITQRRTVGSSFQPLHMIDQKRRNQLGIADDEEEYDLDVALNANTDAGITKIIAGSFILVMLALLVVGLVIPSITDYGDGVCSPIQNGGRC